MSEQRTFFIREILKSEHLDGVLILGLPNMRYLSGFTGTDGALFVGADESIFMTDSRYCEQAREQVEVGRIVCYKDKLKAIGDLLDGSSVQRIGFEAEAVNVALYNDLIALNPSVTWLPLKEQIRSLRGKKSEAELIHLQKAADLNHQAFDTVLPLIKAGQSERDIALELEFTLKKLGGEANAFDFIVASGARGALPHGVASEKKLAQGELVTIDFGTRVQGYHSDETVTLAIGEIDGNLRQIFDIVLEAHDLAIRAVYPGCSIVDLDAVARDYIKLKGYGAYFGHGLGHGVGLEIHEFPGLSSRSQEVLAEGMVVTIEPGIYLPGQGGVRIEDTIVVTPDGCRLLTSIPKQYRQV